MTEMRCETCDFWDKELHGMVLESTLVPKNGAGVCMVGSNYSMIPFKKLFKACDERGFSKFLLSSHDFGCIQHSDGVTK